MGFGKKVTKSELGFEYYKRTRHFDLPAEIEDALEEDYIMNRKIYVDGIFEYVQTLLLISPDITPDQVIDFVHKYPG